MKKNSTNEGLRPLDNEAQMSTKPSVEALAGVSACSVGCGCCTGAGTGPDDCMSEDMFYDLCSRGVLKSAVYVCGHGWMIPEVVVTGCACGCACGCDWGTGCGWGSDWASGSGSGSYFGSDGNMGSGSGCGCGSASGCGCGGTLGEQALERAREYEGTPYLEGGESKSGMDCSGLITVAYQLPIRWTTSLSLENYGFDSIDVREETLLQVLQKGDVLVWPGSHAAIYVGGESIYHAHSTGVGETSDLIRYWVKYKNCPTVYRKK